MTFELLKVFVQAVVLERDRDGRIVGEQVAEPVAVYTLEQLADFIQAVRDQLETQQGVMSDV